ncbi:hypothetical protein ACTXT7_004410 [Hymenolepis weldensis]
MIERLQSSNPICFSLVPNYSVPPCEPTNHTTVSTASTFHCIYCHTLTLLWSLVFSQHSVEYKLRQSIWNPVKLDAMTVKGTTVNQYTPTWEVSQNCCDTREASCQTSHIESHLLQSELSKNVSYQSINITVSEGQMKKYYKSPTSAGGAYPISMTIEYQGLSAKISQSKKALLCKNERLRFRPFRGSTSLVLKSLGLILKVLKFDKNSTE